MLVWNMFHDSEAGLAILFIISIIAYISEFCRTNPTVVVGSSTNCAQYIDCARQKEGYLLECKYPDLFSTSNQRCQEFTTVECEARVEPQAPCMFSFLVFFFFLSIYFPNSFVSTICYIYHWMEFVIDFVIYFYWLIDWPSWPTNEL
jgi:hypothetical protein